MGMAVKMIPKIQTTTTMVSLTTLMPVRWMQEQVRSVLNSVAAITIRMVTVIPSTYSQQSQPNGLIQIMMVMETTLTDSKAMPAWMLLEIRMRICSVAQMRILMVGQISTMPSRMRRRNIPMKTVTVLETLLMVIKGMTVLAFQAPQQRTFLDVRIQTLMVGRI